MTFSLRLTERKTLLILVDLILVNATTLAALWIHATRSAIRFNRAFVLDNIEWFFLLSALWLLSAFLNGFYDPRTIADLAATASALLRTIALVVIAYLAIYFFYAAPNSLPRGIVGYQGAASFVLIGLWRALYALLFQHPTFARKVIIVGAGWAGQTIAEAIQQHARAHYHILGFVDDDPEKLSRGAGERGSRGAESPLPPSTSAPLHKEHLNTSGPLRVLGTCRDLVRLVKEHHVPEVILAVTHDVSTPLFQAILDCQALGVQVTLMPLLYEQITGRVPIQHIGDNWYATLPLEHPGTGGIYPLVKRTGDILGALIGLVLYAPLLPFLALAIYADSPGPIFYYQERVGKGGKVFRLIKLRTMVAEAEKQGAVFTEANDPRITRVGKFLRKTRLDEFPQLINILRGDMSAVGPRALSVGDFKRLGDEIPFHHLRHAVRPGMAGWAQVNYGHPTSVEEARIRLEYDLYYIKHQSLGLDLLILLKMMGRMLTLRGR